MAYQCQNCGEWHESLPLDVGSEAPDPWVWLTAEEQRIRGALGSDDCVIDGEQFFLRGCVLIPVTGTHEFFAWGLWVGVAKGIFELVERLWDAAGRENEPDFAARLANNLPRSVYPSTINLLCRLQLSPVGLRPAIVVESDHPMAREQRDGITIARVFEIAHLLTSSCSVSDASSGAQQPLIADSDDADSDATSQA